MSEENKQTSRREFLKKSIRTTGYVLPVVVALKMSSRKAWAEQYGNNGNSGNTAVEKSRDGKCNSFFEKFFNPSCW
jgi:hypothetical protein